MKKQGQGELAVSVPAWIATHNIVILSSWIGLHSFIIFFVTLSSHTWPPVERLKEGLVVPVATGTLNLLLPRDEVLVIFGESYSTS